MTPFAKDQCNKCGQVITRELLVRSYGGYKRKQCKICIRKNIDAHNKRKARLLKKFRDW